VQQHLTFSPHADLETLLEAAVLALVAMVLVDWAVAAASTRVRQVATHRALEEALASFARELAVVLPRTLVAADDALDARLFPAVARPSKRRGLVVVVLPCRCVVVRRGPSPRCSADAVQPADVRPRLL